MTTRRLSLRHVVPLVILALGLIALGITFAVNTRHSINQLDRHGELAVRSLATITAGSLEAAYRAGDVDQARAAIERLAGHRRIRNALMVNQDQIIEHATQIRWLATPLSERQHDIPQALITHMQQAHSAEILFGGDHSFIYGAFPVRIRGTAEGFVPGATGWLLIEYDLTVELAAMRQQMLVHSVSWALVLLLVTGVFYLFLRRTVLTRISRLQAATRAVASGNFSVQPAIGGDDEIADLAEDFRVMTRNLQRYQDRFLALSLHDPHTGLLNRRGLEQRLAEALDNARTGERCWLLCNFDIEGMKVINSTRGHSAGDALIEQVAIHMRSEFTGQATPARISGDEFAVLLPMPENQPEALAHRVLDRLESVRFRWEEASHPVRFNLGAAVIDVSVAEVETTTSLANAARLAAKEASHVRVRIGRQGDADLDLSTSPMHWANVISEALETDRFELFAQEIRANRRTSSAGLFFEILVRLRQTDGTLVPPGQFLPAAEKYRLAGQVDLWVLKELFRTMKAGNRNWGQLFLCSINLSGLSLGSEEVIATVSAELDSGTIRADQLCFEITETAAITNLSAASDFIERLRGLGCRFALDDFGSGVSSFGYLKSLDVDLLKIDGMFVQGIATDSTDQAIVKSINEIGHQTGKKTIAEFVESAQVARVLRTLGVDYIQGYWVGKPMPLKKMLARLQDTRQTATG